MKDFDNDNFDIDVDYDSRHHEARYLKAFEALCDDYEKSYPKHCRRCGGWGGKWTNYDPSPAGIALSAGYMTEFETCEHCIGSDHCPRCFSHQIFFDENNDFRETCSECLFVLGESDGYPQL